jgi:hypothetical protein
MPTLEARSRTKLTGPQSKHKTYHEKTAETAWNFKVPAIRGAKIARRTRKGCPNGVANAFSNDLPATFRLINSQPHPEARRS